MVVDGDSVIVDASGVTVQSSVARFGLGLLKLGSPSNFTVTACVPTSAVNGTSACGSKVAWPLAFIGSDRVKSTADAVLAVVYSVKVTVSPAGNAPAPASATIVDVNTMSWP